MKFHLALLVFAVSTLAQAQPPQRPLQPFNAWALPGYHAVDPATRLALPDGMSYERVSSVAFTPEGHLLVMHRGEKPFLEFDSEGRFLRAFGDKVGFQFVHGMSIDADGNIWATDLLKHLVHKLDRDGNVLMTLGTEGEAGLWDEATGKHLFFQPNETALDSQGNLYVVQGHGIDFGQGPPEPRVLKFSPQGEFITQWGEIGTGPGQFAVAHSIKIDSEDRIYVADRENQRIQIFDTEGAFLDQWTYDAMVCAIYLHDDGFLYLTSGFDGEWAKVQMSDGAMLGSLGSPGSGIGQFGEGHFLVLDEENNVYIADVGNRRVQIYAKD